MFCPLNADSIRRQEKRINDYNYSIFYFENTSVLYRGIYPSLNFHRLSRIKLDTREGQIVDFLIFKGTIFYLTYQIQWDGTGAAFHYIHSQHHASRLLVVRYLH